MRVVNGIECYGELLDDSNFDVICENEKDDSVWCEGNVKGESFKNWKEVVTFLSSHYNSDILEIHAV